MADKSRMLMASLILIILILGSIVLYSFVIKPKYTGYVIAKQNEGISYTVASVLNQLQQQGYVIIPTDSQGHYVVLTPAQEQPGLPQQAEAETPAQ